MEDMDMGNIIFYTNSSTSSTPPSSGWVVSNGQAPAPSVVLEPKTISIDKNYFVETHLNDGTTKDSIKISFNKVAGDIFSGQNGEDFVGNNKVSVSNLPAGMTGSIIRKSDSTLVFTIDGAATAHVNANDVSNLVIKFAPAAFKEQDTLGMKGASQKNLQLNFRQSFLVAANGGIFTTIKAAVAGVTPYDIIELEEQTITENGITVNKPLVFWGKSADKTIIQGHAQKDMASDRVFSISYQNFPGFTANDPVIFKHLTIRHGKHLAGNGYGGGINANAPVELYNCAISHNIAKSVTEGLAYGGGIAATSVKAFNTLIDNNTLTNGNDAGQIIGGGISTGALWLENCTVVGNYSSYIGGGISASSATIINSTITNNTAKTAGGGVQVNHSTSNIYNSIISGNTSSLATAADLCRVGGTVNVSHSIITKAGIMPNAGAAGPALNGKVTNLIVGDPMLNTLAENGGPTQTISLKTGSPAIDAGLSASWTPATDQRGEMILGRKDVGAFETTLCGLESNTFSFDKDTIIVNDSSSYTIDAGNSYKDFKWSSNETTQSIDVTSTGVYKVTLKDKAKGCVGSDSIYVRFNVITSILAQEALGEFAFYPNPSQGIVKVKSTQGTLSVSNLIGEKVAEATTLGEQQIDISQEPKGVYIIKFTTTTNKVFARKFIKE